MFTHAAVQIMCVEERHHWIATSLTANEVKLYDSSYNGRLSQSLEMQIAQLYQQAVTDTGLVVTNQVVTVAPFQQQVPGSNNCGLFCIAAAVEVAEGHDACSISSTQISPNHLLRGRKAVAFSSQGESSGAS